MSADDIIRQMEALLDEERAAIARLDGTRVSAIAAEKLSLARQLEAICPSAGEGVARALRRLVQNLRVNGVLLAQAHTILADALMGPGLTMSVGRRSSLSGRPPGPRRLSIRG